MYKKWMLPLLTLSLLGGGTALADGSSFLVEPIFGDEQTEKDTGYFDYKVTPSQEINYQINVKNVGSDPIKVKATVNDAITNSSGNIDYTQGVLKDPFKTYIKPSFSSMMDKTDEVLTLNGGEEKVVTFKVNTPSEPFKGQVLGGFFFETLDDEEEEATGGISIKNKFAYSIAALMTEGEDLEQAPKYGYIGTEIGQINYRNVVYAKVLNETSIIQDAKSIESFIYRASAEKTDDNILFKQRLEDLRFAPQSPFLFPVYLNDIHFEPGEYTIKTVLTDKDNKKWEFEDNFTITKDEARKYNDVVVSFSDEDDQKSVILYIVIGVIVILVIVGGIVILRKKK